MIHCVLIGCHVSMRPTSGQKLVMIRRKETKCLRDANSEFSATLTTSLEDFIHISFKDE